MRKKVIAGNWKMYKNNEEALSFIKSVSNVIYDNCDAIICAPFPCLSLLVENKSQYIKIAAQNMNENNEGAYTGEVSAIMLKNIGVEYCVIGHSERREYYNETDEKINLKLKKALEYSITPILCVGEKLDIRENNLEEDWLTKQLDIDLKDFKNNQIEKIIIAYEPIWAIGTGKTATAQIANETCGFIRKYIEKHYGIFTSEKILILYGGSVKVSNIGELVSKPNIDGALIGGASLSAVDYLEMIKIAKES